ncbi:MAG: hypothetical protein DSY42_01170 [Aquifex sp.]|nr:MAG: hypothetical protein DSY42_01170 [Aquifex sp.]
MDGKKKRKQNKRNWMAAKRLATSIGVPTNNATYTENDSDSNDSVDKCTNLHKNAQILCRVYNRTESDFSEPCDSRIIGVYRINTTSSCMKFLTKGDLQTKAMMVDSRGGRHATALAILHEL